jgi:hypothetical protein
MLEFASGKFMALGSGRYRITLIGVPLGSGVTDSQIVSIPGVAKKNCASTPYCVANETICGEIGRFIGLPVPPAGIVYPPKGNDLFYASLDFNLVGVNLPPVNVTLCAELLPDLSTGVVVFDVLIANSDRHGRNLSVDFSPTPPVMNVFDHGHALFGKDVGGGAERMERLRDRLGVSAGSRTAGNRHCLIDQLTTDAYFGRWLDRIRQIPDFFIDDLCSEAVGLGCTKKECADAADFLKYRRGKLGHIIENNKGQFTGIRSWRLFR